MTPETEACVIPVWGLDHRERCGLTLEDGQCPRHGKRGGGYAQALIDDYQRRAGQPAPGLTDPWASYEMLMLRDVLCRLEVILDDEGVDPRTAQRVVRCMLYGSPGRAASEMRRMQDEGVREVLARKPAVIHVDGIHPDVLAKLGIPPK